MRNGRCELEAVNAVFRELQKDFDIMRKTMKKTQIIAIPKPKKAMHRGYSLGQGHECHVESFQLAQPFGNPKRAKLWNFLRSMEFMTARRPDVPRHALQMDALPIVVGDNRRSRIQ